MKKTMLFLYSLLASVACCAQDNPYAAFGYTTKVQYKANAVDIYKVNNTDKTSLVRKMIFDRDNKKILLLDNRDSVIKTVQLTDENILRWTAVDPYAKKYPEMSPYGYAGNNPIKNIDINGDTLHTSGSATATATFKQVADNGMGNIASVSQDKNGNWSLSSLTDDQVLAMTPGQAEEYKALDQIISDPKTSSYSLVDANDPISSKVYIGDNGAAPAPYSATPGVHTIDMGDIKNIGSSGPITSQGALTHELTEGYKIQTQGASGGAAHFGTGIPMEEAVEGIKINLTPSSPPTINTVGNTTTIGVPVTVNGVQKTITITFQNGNVPPGGTTNNGW